MDEDQVQYAFICFLLVFLALFFFVEACIAKNAPPIGHTTGVIVMLGIAMSALVRLLAKSEEDYQQLMKDVAFSDSLFFYLILPLIIFPSGYNMRRKKFFANIGTIMKFGFLGTIICFTVYSLLCAGIL